MDRIFNAFLKHKKSVFIFFVVAAVICASLVPFVSINYNLADYLPKDAQSTTAIRIMQEEFDTKIPNANVMIDNISVQEALEYKEKISSVEGVVSVIWLDDMIDRDILTTTPLAFLDRSVVDHYYKDNSALFRITIKSGMEAVTVKAIYDLIGEKNAASGNAVNAYTTQGLAVTEVLNALAILLPIIIVVLILSTTSWIEPLLFLIAIGVAIIINMGTNVIFNEISFITQTISPILQLAVSLDYAIFLLHSFNQYRNTHQPKEAMVIAMKRALSTVAASAATTMIGFFALIAMRFGIGSDLGLNLVKGIAFSFISVMIFLPAFTLLCDKLIDKTKHRPFLPRFQKLGNGLMKIRIPLMILALIVVVPCFLAQSQSHFLYGMESVTGTSRAGKDADKIEQRFGKENMLVLLVPKENTGKEKELCDDLSSLPPITSTVSYVTAVDANIPSPYISEEILKNFYSKNYARILMYTNTAAEGDDAFSAVQSVMDTAKKYYDSYFLAGESATLYDMKNVVSVDTMVVNLLAIIGIFIVLVVTFRSVVTPVLLVFVIETAIWINVSFAYFTDNAFSFVGYLIISTVQLGATVDYAILLTNRYVTNRQEYDKKEAMKQTLGNNVEAIMISAVILATAGFALALTSSNPIISELGTLLGRGTLLSFVMVVCVLPAFLIAFDTSIGKTTPNSQFQFVKEKTRKDSRLK
jgi:hypothetical protein